MEMRNIPLRINNAAGDGAAAAGQSEVELGAGIDSSYVGNDNLNGTEKKLLLK